MDRAHRTKMAVRHVERVLDFLERAAAKSGGGRIAVVQQSNLVDTVQLSCLSRDVGGREVKPAEEVLRTRPIDLFGDDLSVVVLVELREMSRAFSRPRSGTHLVDHDSIEGRELLEDPGSHLRVQRQLRR